MKKFLLLALVLAACTAGKIEPGHVGVVVPLSGSEKGQLETTQNGWYIYSFNTQVYEFPVYNQQHNWTKAPNEGKSGTDERLYFMDKDGLRVGADVGIQFHVPPGQVTTLFKVYRQDLDHVRDTVLKMEVRNALNVAAQHYTAENMFGDKRADFFKEALTIVQAGVGKNGLEVSNLYLNGELELPEQIRGTIQAKLQATMFAQQKVNEKLGVEAEAAKQVAAAQGKAKAAVAEAEGEAAAAVAAAKGAADARVLSATAEAAANQKVASSLTPAIFELKKLEMVRDVQLAQAQKWNGSVPQTINPGQGSGFIFDLRK